MERREVLKVITAGSVGLIAGYLGYGSIPQVEVTDFEAREQLLGGGQVRVLLTNEGGSGSVDVEIATLRDRNVVLERFTRSIEIGSRTQREETFEIQAPDRTEQVDVEAHASILPDFLRFS
jgi:predicted NAD/FAD-binding protein